MGRRAQGINPLDEHEGLSSDSSAHAPYDSADQEEEEDSSSSSGNETARAEGRVETEENMTRCAAACALKHALCCLPLHTLCCMPTLCADGAHCGQTTHTLC